MDPTLLYENILLNKPIIKKMTNPNTSHIISNYNSINLFPQQSTHTCVSVSIIYALSYLIKINNDIIQLINPFDLHNYITKYKYNKSDLNSKISILDCLYFLHNYNHILNTDIYHFNLQYGLNVFSVKIDWDSIRYYLLNNYPLICNLNLNHNSNNYDMHTIIILGFNNLDNTLSLGIYNDLYETSNNSNIELKYINIDIFLIIVESIFVIKSYK